jgi:hypothetical protein
VIEGTYGFVYCSVNGFGMGVFTIKGEQFIGVDSGGVNYDGTAKAGRSFVFTPFFFCHRHLPTWGTASQPHSGACDLDKSAPKKAIAIKSSAFR